MFTKTRADTHYYTSAKVALMLGISKRTLHNWVKAGKIPEPEVNPANGYYRWRPADVDAIRNILKEEEH